jgi:hypothetical protein
MAPGVLIPTTDRQGSNGYVTGDYILNFNGTSSACPHVAGVAALVLSVNPNLTGQQVRDIIESTAQKVGEYTYQPTADRPNGTRNDQMGYGLVDAYAAVKEALSIALSISGLSKIDCNETTFSVQPIPGASYTWTSSSNIQIVSGASTPTISAKGISYNVTNSWIQVAVTYNKQTYTERKNVEVDIPSSFALSIGDYISFRDRFFVIITADPLPIEVNTAFFRYNWSTTAGTADCFYAVNCLLYIKFDE